MNDLAPRNIKILRSLPISEMTDAEIIKAAVDRLNAKAGMLVYFDQESNRYIFMSQWKSDGYHLISDLKKAWEAKFGKFLKVE